MIWLNEPNICEIVRQRSILSDRVEPVGVAVLGSPRGVAVSEPMSNDRSVCINSLDLLRFVRAKVTKRRLERA